MPVPPVPLRLRSRLRHEPQGPPFRIFEHGQPFLGSVGMPVDHVGSVDEFDAAGFQEFVGLRDVADAQVQNRFGNCGRFLAQHQPRSVAIKERELAECIEMRQTQYAFVPIFRLFDVMHGSCDLRD